MHRMPVCLEPKNTDKKSDIKSSRAHHSISQIWGPELLHNTFIKAEEANKSVRLNSQQTKNMKKTDTPHAYV